ncbi:hypothetical protein [Sphingopyxis sp. Geo48]|uniref:hypothetical protein n=1 Tax=Sphingopyxis sp. Geo48 TaxID=545241 RepID=UPI0024B8028E|nr:hypothetical protein [Sphingopyxis sp. Geo48]
MSTLSIWETVRSDSGLPIIRLDKRMTKNSVTFTGTAGQSAAFDAATSVITVRADVACALAVGANPTAVVTDYPLPADTLMDIEVRPGQKISAIAT